MNTLKNVSVGNTVTVKRLHGEGPINRNSGGNWSHYFEVCPAGNLYWLAVYDGNYLFLLRTESNVHGDHCRICGKNIPGNE